VCVCVRLYDISFFAGFLLAIDYRLVCTGINCQFITLVVSLCSDNVDMFVDFDANKS